VEHLNFSDLSIMDLHVKLNFVNSYKTAGLIFRKEGFKEDWQQCDDEVVSG